MTTLGYTGFTLGSIPVSGIGQRLSQVYTVLNISHVLDNSGYTCRIAAKSHSLGAGEGYSGNQVANSQNGNTSEALQIVQEASRN
jgi:hypothetical protein